MGALLVTAQSAPLVDLAETGDAGNLSRPLIKVTSADKYGVTVSDYFV